MSTQEEIDEKHAKRAAAWRPGDSEYGGGFAPKCSTTGCDTQARWPHGYCATHRNEEYVAETDETKTTPPGSVEFKTATGGV
jgi:hypothetical protein